MLWSDEVGYNPLLAFGQSMVGCQKDHDDWIIGNSLSENECALQCLMETNCVSFDWRPRYQQCRLARTSFSQDSDAESQLWQDCRYYERLSESQDAAVTSVTKYGAIKYKQSYTPSIGFKNPPASPAAPGNNVSLQVSNVDSIYQITVATLGLNSMASIVISLRSHKTAANMTSTVHSVTYLEGSYIVRTLSSSQVMAKRMLRSPKICYLYRLQLLEQALQVNVWSTQSWWRHQCPLGVDGT
jgi:hypothetical protein